MTPTRSTRRRLLQGIGAAGTIGVLGGGVYAQDDENDEDEDEENDEEEEELEDEEAFAAVKLGHLSPDAPEVDVYLGKAADLNPTVGGLSYPVFGPGPNDGYLQVPPGTYDMAVTEAGTTDVVFEAEALELEAGVRYSALAIGLLEELDTDEADDTDENDDQNDDDDDENDENDDQNGVDDDENDENDDENGVDDDENDENDEEEISTELQPLVLIDAEDREEATPEEDEAEISLVHASPDAGEVDVVVNGETLAEELAFGEWSDYLAVDPGEYEIEIVSDDETVLEVTRELRAGTRISAYVTGFATDEEDVDDEDDAEDENDENDEDDAEDENDDENGVDGENDENDENGVEEDENNDDNDDDDDEQNGVDDENEGEGATERPELRVVTALDGTNPLVETLLTR